MQRETGRTFLLLPTPLLTWLSHIFFQTPSFSLLFLFRRRVGKSHVPSFRAKKEEEGFLHAAIVQSTEHVCETTGAESIAQN